MKFKISFFLPPMVRLSFSGLILILLLLCLNCNSVDPPPPNGEKPTLTLILEDVSCVDAWMKLTTTNLQLPASISLKQNNQTRSTINLVKADTLLYIDSLLPNTSYAFHTTIQSSNQTSNELSVTTIDTTSHDFTFETFTFGTIGSSTLYDVAIIDENNIWAVGEINIADTSINGYTTYNALHWDGSQWELKKITIDFRGNLITPPLEGVFAFSSADIWFVGSLPIHGDGENWMMYDLRTTVDPNITVSKAWGSSSNDLYFVGRNGNIARYYNGAWSIIESGTELDIYDIWGDYNYSKSSYEINLVAAQQFIGPERKILTIKNNLVEELSTLNISDGSIHGIWFKADRKYFVVGNGIYTKNNIYDLNNWDDSLGDLTPYYSYTIRGSALNNIFICGSYGELIHFNGFSWRSFRNTPGFFDADFLNIDVKDEIIVAVGQRFSSAFITIGKIQ